MNVKRNLKNLKIRREGGYVGGLILVTIIIVAFLVFLFWPRGDEDTASSRAEVSASITVGVNPDKPGTSKVGYICPGEAVGIAWGTSNAQSAVIEPELGQVALEGFTNVTPEFSTNYLITATSEDDTTTDFATISVIIPSNNTINKTFTAPIVNRDTGLPVNLIWTENFTPSFSSENIVVVGASLVQSPGDWPYWEVRNTDDNGTLHTFLTDATEITDLAHPFSIIGSWEVEPINVNASNIIEAKGRLEIRLFVECKN